MLAVENGADKLRINPGNIGGEKEIALVADCVKAHHIPVRVGANTGSIEKEFLLKYGRSAEARRCLVVRRKWRRVLPLIVTSFLSWNASGR